MSVTRTSRRLFLGAILALPASIAFGRAPPGSDPTSERAKWFAKQENKVGGSCCKMGDGHELLPGDVRFDPLSGLWSVRLPDPSISTFGTDLQGESAYSLPKQWVEVGEGQMRNPSGGPPPVANPIVWYDTRGNGPAATYVVYCLEPNPMF